MVRSTLNSVLQGNALSCVLSLCSRLHARPHVLISSFTACLSCAVDTDGQLASQQPHGQSVGRSASMDSGTTPFRGVLAINNSLVSSTMPC